MLAAATRAGLMPGQAIPRARRGIAVDSTAVYWSEEGGAIRSVPIDGGEARTIATGTRPAPGLAIARGSIYWAASEGVVAAPLGGGTPQLVAPGSPWDIEVLGDDVQSLKAGVKDRPVENGPRFRSGCATRQRRANRGQVWYHSMHGLCRTRSSCASQAASRSVAAPPVPAGARARP